MANDDNEPGCMFRYFFPKAAQKQAVDYAALVEKILSGGKPNPEREVFPGQNEIIARAIKKTFEVNHD